MSEITCRVTDISPLTDTIYKVVLTPQQAVNYKPGHYLQVVMGEKDLRPFSIASIPSQTKLELHIGATPDNKYAWEVLEAMRSIGQIKIAQPKGDAYWRELPRPTLLMAGGTGFSYTYSILQAMLAEGLKEPLYLYWGTRSLDDMYAFQALQEMAQQHDKFCFVPVVENPSNDWQGKTGWVHEAVLADFTSLEPYHVYIAGRFEMAGVAREAFTQKGLKKDHLFGDAYAFI